MLKVPVRITMGTDFARASMETWLAGHSLNSPNSTARRPVMSKEHARREVFAHEHRPAREIRDRFSCHSSKYTALDVDDVCCPCPHILVVRLFEAGDVILKSRHPGKSSAISGIQSPRQPFRLSRDQGAFRSGTQEPLHFPRGSSSEITECGDGSLDRAREDGTFSCGFGLRRECFFGINRKVNMSKSLTRRSSLALQSKHFGHGVLPSSKLCLTSSFSAAMASAAQLTTARIFGRNLSGFWRP